MVSVEQLFIGDVARRAGVQASALRFYERAGIMRPPRRAGGRRVYDASVFESLALIQLARDAGFTIRETKWLLDGFDRHTPASARWQSRAGARPSVTAFGSGSSAWPGTGGCDSLT